jgi:hypothetical protein
MQRHKGFEEVLVRWDPGPAERAVEAPDQPADVPSSEPADEPSPQRPA